MSEVSSDVKNVVDMLNAELVPEQVAPLLAVLKDSFKANQLVTELDRTHVDRVDLWKRL